MRRSLTLIAVIAAFLSIISPLKANAQNKGYDGKFLPQSYVTNSEKPTLVMLTASWCPPCNTMKKQVMKEKDVEETLGKMNVVLLDVDTKEGKELAPGFTEVGFENAIPYFCILDKNGKAVKALTGGTSAEQFLKFLSFAFK